MKKLKFLVVFGLAVFAQPAGAEILSVADYLDLVRQNNTELQSVQANIDTVKGKIAEIERAYSFYLSAGINYANDQSGRPYSPMLRINRVANLGYDVSINKQFKTGTQFSAGLNASYGQYDYGSGLAYELNDIAPFVRLQQSLLKEYKGGTTKASMALAKAKAKSVLYMLEYKKQAIILNAKLAYWNLSYTRTVVDFRKASLERTNKLLIWNERRYKLDLAENSDMLQSQAAVKARELMLKLAKEDEIKARRAFNQILNIADETVNYEVVKFVETGVIFEKDKKLEKKGIRMDVLSALEEVKSAEYEQMISENSMGADLVLSGQFSLNGLDEKFAKASEYVAAASKPAYALGLRYSVPLDFKLRKTINQGYESSKLAAIKAAEFASVQEKNEWLQIVDNWNNAKSRLALTIEIENIQKQRNIEDQNLLRKGRRTTYLVLQSEQDLDDSTLNVLRGIFELISIYEQAEAFYCANDEIIIE